MFLETWLICLKKSDCHHSENTTVTHSNHSTESTDFGFVQSNSYHTSQILQDRVQNKPDPSFSTHGKEQDIESECFEQGPTP